jgi:hypothetical protein
VVQATQAESIVTVFLNILEAKSTSSVGAGRTLNQGDEPIAFGPQKPKIQTMKTPSFPMFSACDTSRDVAHQAECLARQMVNAGCVSPDDDVALWTAQSAPWHTVFEVQFEEALAKEVVHTWQARHCAFSPLLRLFLEAVSRLKPVRFAEACRALEQRMAKDPADQPTFRQMLLMLASVVKTVTPAHLDALGWQAIPA